MNVLGISGLIRAGTPKGWYRHEDNDLTLPPKQGTEKYPEFKKRMLLFSKNTVIKRLKYLLVAIT